MLQHTTNAQVHREANATGGSKAPQPEPYPFKGVVNGIGNALFLGYSTSIVLTVSIGPDDLVTTHTFKGKTISSSNQSTRTKQGVVTRRTPDANTVFPEITIKSETKPEEVAGYLIESQTTHLIFESTEVFEKVMPHLSGCELLTQITVHGQQPKHWDRESYNLPNNLKLKFGA